MVLKHILINFRNIKVSYSGNGNSHNSYFKNKDYVRIIEILSENLFNNLITIDYDLNN